MSTLKLFLLGSPRVEYAGAPVAIRRRKALALLAYLAVAGQPQRRDVLAALLWPESSQDQARKALRRDLSELNLALGGAWLEADRESAGLRSGYCLDVDQFWRCLDQPAASSTEGFKHVEQAVSLYQGDFLSGFSLSDAAAFDEWQLFQAETLRHACASALERLALVLSEQGNPEGAIPHARRRLALDPLHEPAHRQLMQLYVQAGQQAAALRQYERCRAILEAELGIPPALETTSLYEQIRARKLDSATAIPPSVSRAPLHNLPTQTTSFIGREPELAEIRRLLLDEPDCRLLNLFGPGGIGKTRLALAVAKQSLEAFPHGVYFVSLAPVGEAALIVQAIAEALRFTFYGQADPEDQLLDYLSQKRLLLVVDNVEHLLDGADLLSKILRQAPEVSVLATSRERLHLQEEWVYEVQGLPFPASKEPSSAVSNGDGSMDAYAAVQLFVHRARQIEPGFRPSTDELADIARICQLVEGMPLGLELAAPWIRTLSCREIAAEIEHSLDFLTAVLRNVPERHRSLRAICEQTWGRLSRAEQAVLMRLSVFRGGCTREAATAVAGATLPVLSSLVDKALVRRTNLGRYELHEVIRQFAEAQLQIDHESREQTQQRHRDFFSAFLEAHTHGVKGSRQFEALAEIEADIDNVRLAWRSVVAHRQPEAIERAAECLFVYYLYRNGYDEGVLEFGQAMAAIAGVPENLLMDGWRMDPGIHNTPPDLGGFLLAGLGYFIAHRRNLQRGQVLLEQALALVREKAPGNRRTQAFALLWLGWALYFQGQLIQGKRFARESLALLNETADHWGEGWALLLLGNCLRNGRPAEAEIVYETGRALCQKTGDQIVLSYLIHNIGVTACELGRYAPAQQHIDIAVTISEKFDNMLGLGYALLSRGRVEIAEGKYRQAIQSLHQSVSYFNKVGTVHASRAQMYLGLAHHRQGDQDLAARLYDQALGGLKAAKSRLDLTQCLNCLGCLAFDQGKLDQAEQLQRESLALLQETEQEPAMVAATLRYLGQLMVASGDHRHAEARKYFQQALELAIEHQLAPIALDVCVGAARLLALTGKIDQAVELLVLAKQHEASTFEICNNARRLLADLLEQVQLETAELVETRGRSMELWACVRLLLAEFAKEFA